VDLRDVMREVGVVVMVEIRGVSACRAIHQLEDADQVARVLVVYVFHTRCSTCAPYWIVNRGDPVLRVTLKPGGASGGGAGWRIMGDVVGVDYNGVAGPLSDLGQRGFARMRLNVGDDGIVPEMTSIIHVNIRGRSLAGQVAGDLVFRPVLGRQDELRKIEAV